VLEAREAARRVGQEGKTQETRLRLQLQDATDSLAVVKGDWEQEKARLQVEAETLRRELVTAQQEAAAAATQQQQQSRRQTSSLSVSSLGGLGASATGRAGGAGGAGEPVSQTSILERTITGGSTMATGDAEAAMGSPGVSVLAVEKLRQALRQKEEAVLHLQARLQDVERTRDALTQEVTTLGKRSALLQGSLRAARALKAEAAELAHKNGVLLELLGEKTEELEAVQAEVSDLKAHFRRQLDELLVVQQHAQH